MSAQENPATPPRTVALHFADEAVLIVGLTPAEWAGVMLHASKTVATQPEADEAKLMTWASAFRLACVELLGAGVRVVHAYDLPKS